MMAMISTYGLKDLKAALKLEIEDKSGNSKKRYYSKCEFKGHRLLNAECLRACVPSTFKCSDTVIMHTILDL